MDFNNCFHPVFNQKYDFDKPFDKGLLLDSYIKYYLARLQSMFKYTGLPDSIPSKWLEHFLLVNGQCIFCKNGDDLIVTTGGQGGDPDIYYIPTKYIVANPYVKAETRKTYTIGEDCVLIRNDTYSQGLIPLLTRYCTQLVENDISLNVTDIIARAMLTITAASTQDKESVDLWFKKLRQGELGAIGELPSMVGNNDKNINITPFRECSSVLTNLIEYHQYLKASLYNEIGLNANYNMKRESINSNESQLNDDMLTPLIDDMLARRKEALEEVNAMFGTSISVEFNSAWEENEIEHDKALEGVSGDQTEVTPEVTPEASTEEVETEEVDTETDILPEAPEEAPEETPEDKDIVEAIEDVAEAIEDLAGDQEEYKEEDKEGDEDAENNT